MKIISVEIVGFGKWENTTFDDFGDFQMIYGENEAGKSTIMAFIHSILFGFPAKQSSYLRMEPKNKGAYGGKLTLSETRFGTVVIERLRGKSAGDVTVHMEDGSRHGEEKLNEILNGMDRRTYEAIFSFNIHGLQQIGQMKQEEFEKYLLATGTAGSDRLLLMNESLKKQLDDLFKPGGKKPVINQAVEAAKKSRDAYLDSKEQNEKYAGLVSKMERLEQQEAERAGNKRALQIELANLERLKEKWPIYSEKKVLAKQISQQMEFPPDGLARFDQLETRFNERNHEQMQLEERKKALAERNLVENELDAGLAGSIQELLESFRVYQDRAQQLKEQETESELLARQVGMDFSRKPLDANFDEEIAQISLADRDLERGEQENRFAIEAEQKEEKRIQQEVDELEGLLWTSEKTHEKEVELKKEKKQSPYLLGGAVILLILGISLALFIPGFLGYILLVMALVLFLAGFFKKTENTDEVARIELEEQRRYRAKWKELLGKLDEVLMRIASLEETKAKLDQERERIELEKAKLYEPLGLKQGISFDADMAFVKESYTKWLRLQDLKERRNVGRAFLKEWEKQLQRFPAEGDSTEEKVASLRHKLRVYRENAASAAKNEEKMEQLDGQLDLAKRDLRKMREEMDALLAAAQANSELEFRELGLRDKELRAARERFTLLSAQLPETLDFSAYPDFEALKEAELKRKEELTAMDAAQAEFERVRAETRHEIAILEEGGTFSYLMQEYYLKRDRVRELADEWMTLKLAEELTNRTVAHLQETKFPKALELATFYFGKLTGGRYTRVSFNDAKRIEVKRSDFVVFKPEELSQATKEQLYLAIRLALIEIIAEDFPFPILIDDGFVNFDAERLDLLMQLLKYRKDENQVIFFSCHKETSKYFSDNRLLVLY